MEKSLFTRIVEDIIVLFICAVLIKLGISYIISVKVPLIIIAVIIAIAFIGYRIYKWRDRNDY